MILSQLEVIVVVALRLIGFFAAAPFFSGKYINRYAKIGLSIILAVLVYTANPSMKLAYSFIDAPVAYAEICVVEVVIGLMIGFAATIIFNAIIFAGTLIDSQAGLTMATVYDPSNSMQLAITANLYYYALVTIFLATNMHHSFIKAIFFSYDMLPIGQMNVVGPMITYIITLMEQLFLLAFKFASPIIAVMLIMDVALGVLVRAVPQMNIFVVGFPIKVAMFLFIMILGTNIMIDNYAFIYDKSLEVIINIMRLLAIKTT